MHSLLIVTAESLGLVKAMDGAHRVPQRSRKYGAGKEIGGALYVHRDYEHVLPQEDLQQAKKTLAAALPDHDYHVIKHDPRAGTFSFIHSPDFDSAHEPTQGDSALVKPDGTVKVTRQLSDPNIYHHKHIFVAPDYKGFDVAAAEKRSQQWSNEVKPGESSRIGRQSYWENEVLPRVGLSKAITGELDSELWPKSIKQEFPSSQTSMNKSKLPASFSVIDKIGGWKPGTVNADIGGGKYDNHTAALAEKGVTNHIFDPFNRHDEHNENAVRHIANGQAHTVTVNNVLNVIKEPENRDRVIRQAANALHPEGTAHFWLHRESGKVEGKSGGDKYQLHQPASFYADHIKQHFGEVTVGDKHIIARKPLAPLTKSMDAGGWLELWEGFGADLSKGTGATKYDWCSTQVNAPPAVAEKVIAWTRANVPQEALHKDGGKDYGGDSADKGIELEPHITVKYGLAPGDGQQESDLAEGLQNVLSAMAPVSVTLGKLALFRTNEDFDVLYISIESPGLRKMNKAICKYARQHAECNDTHPVYTPHLTLAYLKKGAGDAFDGNDELSGQRIDFNHVLLSDRNGEKHTLTLGGDISKSLFDGKPDEPVRGVPKLKEHQWVPNEDAYSPSEDDRHYPMSNVYLPTHDINPVYPKQIKHYQQQKTLPAVLGRTSESSRADSSPDYGDSKWRKATPDPIDPNHPYVRVDDGVHRTEAAIRNGTSHIRVALNYANGASYLHGGLEKQPMNIVKSLPAGVRLVVNADWLEKSQLSMFEAPGVANTAGAIRYEKGPGKSGGHVHRVAGHRSEPQDVGNLFGGPEPESSPTHPLVDHLMPLGGLRGDTSPGQKRRYAIATIGGVKHEVSTHEGTHFGKTTGHDVAFTPLEGENAHHPFFRTMNRNELDSVAQRWKVHEAGRKVIDGGDEKSKRVVDLPGKESETPKPELTAAAAYDKTASDTNSGLLASGVFHAHKLGLIPDHDTLDKIIRHVSENYPEGVTGDLQKFDGNKSQRALQNALEAVTGHRMTEAHRTGHMPEIATPPSAHDFIAAHRPKDNDKASWLEMHKKLRGEIESRMQNVPNARDYNSMDEAQAARDDYHAQHVTPLRAELKRIGDAAKSGNFTGTEKEAPRTPSADAAVAAGHAHAKLHGVFLDNKQEAHLRATADDPDGAREAMSSVTAENAARGLALKAGVHPLDVNAVATAHQEGRLNDVLEHPALHKPGVVAGARRMAKHLQQSATVSDGVFGALESAGMPKAVHEMTFSEYLKAHPDRGFSGLPSYSQFKESVRSASPWQKESAETGMREREAEIRKHHAIQINHALQEGKQVPPHVLAEYPELSKPTVKEPWQMSLPEYSATNPLPRRQPGEFHTHTRAGEIEGKHRDAVGVALQLGHPVPPDVLRQYPLLQHKLPEQSTTHADKRRGLPL